VVGRKCVLWFIWLVQASNAVGAHTDMVAVAICCILVLLAVFIVLIIVVGQSMGEPKPST